MPDDELIDWLLTAETPSIRYITLVELLDRPEEDAYVQAARSSLHSSGPVPAILAEQQEAGYWLLDDNFYGPKYRGSHWSMMLLEELRANPADPRVRGGANYILEMISGGLEVTSGIDNWVETPNPGWDCLWGNMLRYLVYTRYSRDPRTQPIIKRLAHNISDGKSVCKANAWLPCAWGVARALWGLSAIPDDEQTDEVKQAIALGVEFLLDQYDLLAAAYPSPDGDVSRYWHKLQFPLFYQCDLLFVLRVLRDLGQLGHPRAQPAIDWLIEKRQGSGRWRGSSPFRSRTWGLGEREDTNRWVTLQALLILKEAGRAA
ncbi:MAG: hypothetical protein GYB68_13910 [Chloroflexi bacterium]|nr:hypothetical protein [Chloroflexota bacterium]